MTYSTHDQCCKDEDLQTKQDMMGKCGAQKIPMELHTQVKTYICEKQLYTQERSNTIVRYVMPFLTERFTWMCTQEGSHTIMYVKSVGQSFHGNLI
ncbi:hypothetical protein MAR_002890 [Mya arenaria]|uniref:Uncharacterized protein n=1 Tax=Mya arenaria TaxID=6604 RepID=A0ABY7G7M1_MYAAR|nr:hypothetical protein MAR_002890 [Mya arenaria]